MILATGGNAMVRSAYSSSNPAIGVGPGNAPVYVDETADIGHIVNGHIADIPGIVRTLTTLTFKAF